MWLENAHFLFCNAFLQMQMKRPDLVGTHATE